MLDAARPDLPVEVTAMPQLAEIDFPRFSC